jgi:hypothetical protein
LKLPKNFSTPFANGNIPFALGPQGSYLQINHRQKKIKKGNKSMSQGGLIFYDAAGGTGEFYSVSNGRISLVYSHTDWRNTWTHIVPGKFGGNGIIDLLFYEGSTGVAEFYALDIRGAISIIQSNTGWPTNLTQIIPGNFSGSGNTDLLFYDNKAGTGQFFTVNKGKISPLHTETGWRTSWNQILPIPAPIEGSYYSSGIPSGVAKELY